MILEVAPGFRPTREAPLLSPRIFLKPGAGNNKYYYLLYPNFRILHSYQHNKYYRLKNYYHGRPQIFRAMERFHGFLNAVYVMSPELSEHLRAIVKYREIAKGDLLLKAGHICRDIHFVDKGMLRCF